MHYALVRILDLLHIVRRNDDAQVAEGRHFAALEPRQAKYDAAGVSSRANGVEHVRGIAAAADRKCDVVRLNQGA